MQTKKWRRLTTNGEEGKRGEKLQEKKNKDMDLLEERVESDGI